MLSAIWLGVSDRGITTSLFKKCLSFRKLIYSIVLQAIIITIAILLVSLLFIIALLAPVLRWCNSKLVREWSILNVSHLSWVYLPNLFVCHQFCIVDTYIMKFDSIHYMSMCRRLWTWVWIQETKIKVLLCLQIEIIIIMQIIIFITTTVIKI